MPIAAVLYNTIFFGLGLVAAQRFALPNIHVYIAVIPAIICAVLLATGSKNAIAYAILALFLSVDLGGDHYTATPGIIRYVIYALCILSILRISVMRIQFNRFVIFGIFSIILFLASLSYALQANSVYDAYTSIRDILIYVCIFLCLIDSEDHDIDMSVIFYTSLGFVLAEIINMNLYFSFVQFGYMSLDSLKAFILFPVFYALMNRYPWPVVLILAITVLGILFNYNTKMIIIAFFASIIIATCFFSKGINKKIGYMFGFFVVLYLFPLFFEYTRTLTIFGTSRIFWFFNNIFSSNNIWQMLNTNEAMRFHQYFLFFDRDMFSVLFGNGFGAGISGASSELRLVADGTGFSDNELETGNFFNFHDIWVDFGVRFGFVATLVILALILRFGTRQDIKWLGAFIFVIVINATFSISGVLVTTALIKIYQNRKALVVPGAVNKDEQGLVALR